MDWVSTRPLVPGSNSQCTRPGSGSNVCFQHPDTGRSSCTGELPPLLKSMRKELQNIQITHRTCRFKRFNIKSYIPGWKITFYPTLLFGCNLTRHTGDVTIETSPPSLTLAGVRGSLLPARTSIFTGGGITPAHKILIGN